MKQISLRAREQGQGMTEYIIIIAVVAVLSLAVIIRFGDNIRELFLGSGSNIVGTQKTLDDHMDGQEAEKGLDDFGKGWETE